MAYYFTMAAYGDLISGVKPVWAQVLRGMPNFDQPLTLVIHRNWIFNDANLGPRYRIWFSCNIRIIIILFRKLWPKMDQISRKYIEMGFACQFWYIWATWEYLFLFDAAFCGA